MLCSEDQSKITKLLMLSTSSNEHEALLAIRTANKILHTRGLDWNKLFAALEDSVRLSIQMEKEEEESDIIGMIALCLNYCEGGTLDFIQSIEKSYYKYGDLTEKQLEALRKVFRRALKQAEDVL